MSILIDENSRIVVCGITGKAGSLHTRKCLQYGSKIVSGVCPGKGGTLFAIDGHDSVPVFDSVSEAVSNTHPDVALIFVPPAFAADSIFECIDSNLPLIICITEGISVQDMTLIKAKLRQSNSRLIGPNCPGVFSPGKCNLSIIPESIALPGRVGVVSKSGTLTYEAIWQLTSRGIGQSTCVGIGGDPISGSSHTDIVKLFNEDPDTEAIVMIGEIGGNSEIQAAEYIKQHVKKPVVAFIAGVSAPKGKRMGHAGAIVSGDSDSAAEKIKKLKSCGIAVADLPTQIASTLLNIYHPGRK